VLNRKKLVTLKDIANATGYSINTVSKAINGDYPSENTTQLIVDTARKMGYVGNNAARSMRSGSTKSIAVIVGDIANPYFARIVKGTVNFFQKRDYNTIIFNTEERIDYERNAICSALRMNVDGILICPIGRDNENLQIISGTDIPFVVFNGYSSDARINTVNLDNEKGGYLATKHLLEQGHRNIAFINVPEKSFGATERLAGYRRALSEYGIPAVPQNVLTVELYGKTVDWEYLRYQLQDKAEYTALVVFSDLIAMRLLQMFDRTPDKPFDVSCMVSFDNTVDVFPVPVRLSSVDYANVDIATMASHILLQNLMNPDLHDQHILLDVKLYER